MVVFFFFNKLIVARIGYQLFVFVNYWAIYCNNSWKWLMQS